jgi:hypothetical protein
VKLVLNHFLTMPESHAIIDELSALAVLDKRFTGRMRVSELDAKRIVHRYRDDRQQLREKFGIGFKIPREGMDGNAVPDMATLKDDVTFLLNAAKSHGFTFYETFSQKRDFLFPLIA